MDQNTNINADISNYLDDAKCRDDSKRRSVETIATGSAVDIKEETSEDAAFKMEETELEEEVTFVCTFCEYKTNEKSNLDEHIRIHKPFRCLSCDFKSADSAGLNFHLRTHTELQPFACNICEYRAGQIKELTRHMKTHAKLPSFKCAKCDFTTTHKRCLNQHMKSHPKEKLHRCSCSYKASCKVHPQERMLKCSLCHYMAKQTSHLRNHMIIHKDMDICCLCGLITRKKQTAEGTFYVCDECSNRNAVSNNSNMEVKSGMDTDGDLVLHTVTCTPENDLSQAYRGLLEESEQIIFDIEVDNRQYEIKVERADIKEEVIF